MTDHHNPPCSAAPPDQTSSSPTSHFHRRHYHRSRRHLNHHRRPMKQQKIWPSKSDSARVTALPFSRRESRHHYHSSSKSKSPGPTRNSTSSSSKTHVSNNLKDPQYDYSMLPDELVHKIAASLSLPDLRAALLVCRAWRDALQPLMEATEFWSWGKRFKHGRGGVRPNVDKALYSFLEGAARGSTLAMVDAGLMYWLMGEKEKAVALYRQAAEIGDPDPPSYKEAVKWLYKASFAGHVRAQYQLALCLHQGRGVDQNIQEAAQWYKQAAEGGYVRAMYNISLCYSFGKGVAKNDIMARKWMKQAADLGHSKAQLEHGLCLSSEGDKLKAVVYLELATRAGETAATHEKNVILQNMSRNFREKAMYLADTWPALPPSRFTA